MITPESLQKIAEYMGYEVEIDIAGRVIYEVLGATTWIEEYLPLQNSDQCLELMEKFRFNLDFTDKEVCAFDEVKNIASPFCKTINEAVTLAAIAYVEDLDNGIL